MSRATCEEISGELVAYLDGELPDTERRPVAAHLSTCLGCRREAERLGTVQRWVAGLPRIEPSAGFDAEFWRRMNAAEADVPAPRRWRVWTLAVPLAAAALVAIVMRSTTTSPPATTASAPVKQVAAAPAHPAAAPAPAVAANEVAPPREEPAQVADAHDQLPEDLPPELVEHPELFLRLPVVRRLDKLEHFEEVRQRTLQDGTAAPDGAG